MYKFHNLFHFLFLNVLCISIFCLDKTALDTDNKSKDDVVVEKPDLTESDAEGKKTGTVTTPPAEELYNLKQAETSTSVAEDSSEDAIAETLLCIICQGLLHDCIR